MQTLVREHVVGVTALLSAVSLALVFGAAGQQLPTAFLPEFPLLFAAIPHVNAAISLAAIATISLGWRAIRRGDVARHRLLMLASFALFAGFLALYLYRVAMVGPQPFSGPATVRTFVYLPLLTVHVALAVICVPLLYYVLLLAATRSPRELSSTAHPRIGRIAAPLWLVSFLLGLVVYALLHGVY